MESQQPDPIQQFLDATKNLAQWMIRAVLTEPVVDPDQRSREGAAAWVAVAAAMTAVRLRPDTSLAYMFRIRNAGPSDPGLEGQCYRLLSEIDAFAKQFPDKLTAGSGESLGAAITRATEEVGDVR